MTLRSLFIFGTLWLAGCTQTDYQLDNSALTAAIVDWNEQVLKVAEAEDGFLTLKGLRTTTMMHLAMHDALATVDNSYASYLEYKVESDIDPVIAMSWAAFTIAADQYPDQKQLFTTLLDSTLALTSSNSPQAPTVGKQIAHSILHHRSEDGWDTEAAYQWHPMAPGVYAEFNEHSGTPEGFIFGAGWGQARPFALQTHDQFLAPAPPAIESEAYTEAFNEVREAGRHISASRTDDQTHLALWWKDFAENSHNRLARDLISKEQLSPVETARFLALLNMSIFDAYVSSFHNKFLYNHWRPYTAIRWAANDNNPNTSPEPDWNNTHQHTYAFPSYPSAHGTACASAMAVFSDTFGDAYPFTMSTREVDIAGPFSGKMNMDPPTRSFSSFSEAASECGMSRVYLGIHFRYDSVEGVNLGTQVGTHAVNSVLLPNKN